VWGRHVTTLSEGDPIPIPLRFALTGRGPYEVVALIAAGTTGEVYKARDTRTNATVAIKVLPPEFFADPEMKQRFENHAQTIAAFNHPNICTLLEIARQGDKDFIVTEYLDGQSLAARLKRDALPLDEALNVAIATPSC
jgi:serine/threonine protein kinase